MASAANEATVRVNGTTIHLLGTIAGFVPDGLRIRAAFANEKPDQVALGIPQEDLDALARLAIDPQLLSDLPELDDVDARFHAWLARFGEVSVPSPDLEAAFTLATASAIPMHALDLDDEAHANAYTSRMKVRHLVRAGSRRRKAIAMDLSHIGDPYELASAWDDLLAIKPLRAIEAERTAHMAQRLRALAAAGGSVLAVVPSIRLAGIAAALRD